MLHRSWIGVPMLFVLAATALLAEDKHPSAETPPQLKPLFADDFQTDSREQYELQGDASWSEGRLTLATGSSLNKKLDAGSRVELKLGMPPSKLEKDGDRAVTVLQFDLQGATACQVVWMASKSDGKTIRRVRIYDTEPTLLGTKRELIREHLLATEVPDGNWTVTYRHGLLTVNSPRRRLLTGYLENGTATVEAVGLRAVYQPTQVTTVKVDGVDPPSTLSREARDELATANQHNKEVVLLWREGKSALAIEPARKALEIRRRVLGKHHRAYGLSLFNLAAQYAAVGEYARARPLYIEARDNWKKLLGEDHPHYANSLNNLALLHQSMGAYLDAEPLFLEARDIKKQALGEEHPQYASSLNNLALLYRAIGDYSKVEPLLLESRDIYKTKFGEENAGYSDALVNLATHYHSLGDYTKAELLHVKALEIDKKVIGEGHPKYAATLNGLAGVYVELGDYAKAEPLFLKSTEILKKTKHPDYASSLNNLALLYSSMLENAKAEFIYLEALDIGRNVHGEQHPNYAQGLVNLGWLYQSRGHYAKAEPMFQKALVIYENVGKEHPHYATTLNNLAWLYQSQGDYAKAEPRLLRVRDIRRNILGVKHPDYSRSLSNLGWHYQSQGEYAKAAPFNREALQSQNSLAILRLSSTSEAQGLNYLANQPIYKDAWMSNSLKLTEPPSEIYASLWPSRRLLQRVTAQRNRQHHLTRDTASEETKQDLQAYSLARRRLGRLMLAAGGTNAMQAKQRKLAIARLDAEKERLEKALSDALPDFAAELRNQQSQPRELMAQLPADAVFIDLMRYTLIEQDPQVPGANGERKTPSYAAFVVYRGQPIARVELGPAEPIDNAVLVWRASVAQGKSDTQAAQTVSKLVWQPLAKTLPDGATTLYLCPDSSLAVIPWAALRTGNSDRVLLEDYHVALVPHGHYLLRQLGAGQAASEDPRLLVVGDVDYGRRAESAFRQEDKLAAVRRRGVVAGEKRIDWQALPGGRREAADVARLAASRTVTALATDQATTGNVLRELPKCQYAHFATHGFFAHKKFRTYLQVSEEMFDRDRGFGRISNRSTFAGRNPLVLSGLVFAGANLPRENDEYGIPTDDGGILPAEAIASLPLYDLRLAVLSACETGLGDVAGGEGAYGLQRAFHTAGTHNVLASLWKVNDDATAALMRLFYYKLWKENKTPLEALREAQLFLYRHPAKIKDLARAPNFTKTETLVRDTASTDTQRLATKDWAAFVLSGLGK